jgi:hypothetical protein
MTLQQTSCASVRLHISASAPLKSTSGKHKYSNTCFCRNNTVSARCYSQGKGKETLTAAEGFRILRKYLKPHQAPSPQFHL